MKSTFIFILLLFLFNNLKSQELKGYRINSISENKAVETTVGGQFGELWIWCDDNQKIYDICFKSSFALGFSDLKEFIVNVEKKYDIKFSVDNENYIDDRNYVVEKDRIKYQVSAIRVEGGYDISFNILSTEMSNQYLKRYYKKKSEFNKNDF